MRQGEWFTSSFTGHEPSCVEVFTDGENIQVRDTKDRDGGKLTYTPKEWQAFLDGVKAGEFDL